MKTPVRRICLDWDKILKGCEFVVERKYSEKAYIEKVWKISGVPEAVNMIITHAHRLGWIDAQKRVIKGE